MAIISLQSSASALSALNTSMDVIANNLANVSTNGFKRDGIAFNDALLREMEQGGREIGSVGVGAAVESIFTDFSVGAVTDTGNPLDLALQGTKGLFAIQTPAGVRYTRDGSFGLDANRRLITKDGYPVLDDKQTPITLEEGQISIQEDGTVQIDGDAKAKIGVFDASGFAKEGSNRFIANGPTTPIETTLKSGAIESSNVNAVDAMVQMIQLSRLFEMSQKSIVSQDEMSQRLIQSMQDR